MSTPPGLARIMITGSRSWADPQLLGDTLMGLWYDALQDGYAGILITHGTADGADQQADAWAIQHGVPYDRREADWGGPCAPDCQPGHRKPRGRADYCPMAGHRRNQEMVDLGPALCVAFIGPCRRPNCRRGAPGHDSHGTADAIRRVTAAGIPIHHVRPASSNPAARPGLVTSRAPEQQPITGL